MQILNLTFKFNRIQVTRYLQFMDDVFINNDYTLLDIYNKQIGICCVPRSIILTDCHLDL